MLRAMMDMEAGSGELGARSRQQSSGATGVGPLDERLEDEGDESEEGEERGGGEGADEVVFVVEDFDVERQGVGLAADVSRNDGYGAEFAHRAGVAEDDAVEEAP